MANERKNRLETSSVGKLMLELCTQTTFSIMLYNIYTITDTFYVSKGIGSMASGAIGIFAPVLVLINGISSTLGTGAGSILSRRLGEKDRSSGKEVVGCVFGVWCLCALLITIVGLLFLNPLLQLLGCTTDIYPYAVEYGRIMLLSTVISTGFSGLMRAEGDIFFSTLQWCCPVIINIILDPLFIYVFQMGIAGAAFATLLAQLFSMLCSVYYFFIRENTPCRIKITDIHCDLKICKEIVSIGMPSFLYSLSNSLAGTVGNQILGYVGGTQAISTFSVISRIQSFTATPFMGIMQGIQPMLGFNWGRKDNERVKKIVFYAIRFSIIYGFFISIVLHAGANFIINIFTSNVEIISIGTKALQQAYFQALGKGKKVLFLSLGSIFIIRLPLILIGGLFKSLNGMWWIFVLIDWLIAGYAIFKYVKYQGGKIKCKV